jgi:hypothetical protein
MQALKKFQRSIAKLLGPSQTGASSTTSELQPLGASTRDALSEHLDEPQHDLLDDATFEPPVNLLDAQKRQDQHTPRRDEGPAALRNQDGTTCFLNATLQLLSAGYQGHLSGAEGSLGAQMTPVLGDISQGTSVDTRNVRQSLHEQGLVPTPGYRQEDASELLAQVLQQLYEEEGATHHTLYEQEQRSVQTSTLAPDVADNEHQTFNAMGVQTRRVANKVLYLDITEADNLQAALDQRFGATRRRDTDEHGVVDGVMHHITSIDQSSKLEELPEILTIGLNRFSNTGEKNGDAFDAQHHITLRAAHQVNQVEAVDQRYEQVGFIVHQGSKDFGHYWAHIHPPQRGWARADDSRVEDTTTDEQQQRLQRERRFGYVYTYKRLAALEEGSPDPAGAVQTDDDVVYDSLESGPIKRSSFEAPPSSSGAPPQRGKAAPQAKQHSNQELGATWKRLVGAALSDVDPDHATIGAQLNALAAVLMHGSHVASFNSFGSSLGGPERPISPIDVVHSRLYYRSQAKGHPAIILYNELCKLHPHFKTEKAQQILDQPPQKKSSKKSTKKRDAPQELSDESEEEKSGAVRLLAPYNERAYQTMLDSTSSKARFKTAAKGVNVSFGQLGRHKFTVGQPKHSEPTSGYSGLRQNNPSAITGILAELKPEQISKGFSLGAPQGKQASSTEGTSRETPEQERLEALLTQLTDIGDNRGRLVSSSASEKRAEEIIQKILALQNDTEQLTGRSGASDPLSDQMIQLVGELQEALASGEEPLGISDDEEMLGISDDEELLGISDDEELLGEQRSPVGELRSLLARFPGQEQGILEAVAQLKGDLQGELTTRKDQDLTDLAAQYAISVLNTHLRSRDPIMSTSHVLRKQAQASLRGDRFVDAVNSAGLRFFQVERALDNPQVTIFCKFYDQFKSSDKKDSSNQGKTGPVLQTNNAKRMVTAIRTLYAAQVAVKAAARGVPLTPELRQSFGSFDTTLADTHLSFRLSMGAEPGELGAIMADCLIELDGSCADYFKANNKRLEQEGSKLTLLGSFGNSEDSTQLAYATAVIQTAQNSKYSLQEYMEYIYDRIGKEMGKHKTNSKPLSTLGLEPSPRTQFLERQLGKAQEMLATLEQGEAIQPSGELGVIELVDNTLRLTASIVMRELRGDTSGGQMPNLRREALSELESGVNAINSALLGLGEHTPYSRAKAHIALRNGAEQIFEAILLIQAMSDKKYSMSPEARTQERLDVALGGVVNTIRVHRTDSGEQAGAMALAALNNELGLKDKAMESHIKFEWTESYYEFNDLLENYFKQQGRSKKTQPQDLASVFDSRPYLAGLKPQRTTPPPNKKRQRPASWEKKDQDAARKQPRNGAHIEEQLEEPRGFIESMRFRAKLEELQKKHGHERSRAKPKPPYTLVADLTNDDYLNPDVVSGIAKAAEAINSGALRVVLITSLVKHEQQGFDKVQVGRLIVLGTPLGGLVQTNDDPLTELFLHLLEDLRDLDALEDAVLLDDDLIAAKMNEFMDRF